MNNKLQTILYLTGVETFYNILHKYCSSQSSITTMYMEMTLNDNGQFINRILFTDY